MNDIDFTGLVYNADTGLFYRTKNLQKPIGCINNRGYVVFRHKTKLYQAHRVAWYLTYKCFPDFAIDHINEVKTDNRIGNLRLATHQQNMQNQHSPYSSNTSGYRGVCWCKKKNKWLAQIAVNKKRKHIGYFNTPELAHQAYIEAKKIHHPIAFH